MKIKVAIVDSESKYLERFVGTFQQKYADKIEISAFSKKESFEEFVKTNQYHIVLWDCKLKIDEEIIPNGTTLVYLSDMAEGIGDPTKRTITKYQKISLIYKEILNIVSEKMSNVSLNSINADIKTILFLSAQGGTGATTVASAFCVQKARQGASVFYLNLEKLGNTALYFDGTGSVSMSEVLFNIKSKKSNIIMKMESAVQKDSSGVEFFAPYRNANDALEMTIEDQETLIKNIANMKEYQYLVIDMELSLDEKMKQVLMEYANEIVIVSDGTKTANDKLTKLIEVFQIWEERFNIDILGRMNLLYNRFSSTRGEKLSGIPVKMLGGVPRYEGAEHRQIMSQIAQSEVFGAL